jgi:hypothetical protein
MGQEHCTLNLLFDWFGLVCFSNKNKNCQSSYSWFQTSQTGGQRYSDTPPLVFPAKIIIRSFVNATPDLKPKLYFFLLNDEAIFFQSLNEMEWLSQDDVIIKKINRFLSDSSMFGSPLLFTLFFLPPVHRNLIYIECSLGVKAYLHVRFQSAISQ